MNRSAKSSDGANRSDSSPARAELGLVALVVVAGFLLRAAHPARMSVEHFDEGVYASNLAAGPGNDYCYPFQHLYAPPLLPFLIESTMLAGGETSMSAMLVSQLVGGLTPLLIWLAGRRWFGAPAGLAAAALAALSDFHILYSRTALTDAMLCFWFLLAVWLISEAYRRGSLAWACAAGAATALAWWTKYTGWLPLAVAASGIVPWLLFHRPSDRPVGRFVLLWMAMALTAVVLWSPWWNHLKQYGGYAAVADNHGRYLVGVGGWLPSLLQQSSVHLHYSGALSCASLLCGGLLAGFALLGARDNFTWNRAESPRGRIMLLVRSPWPLAGALLLTALAVAFGASLTLGVAALLGMAWQILPRPQRSSSGPTEAPDRALAAWLLAAWYFGVFVSVPAYHPYPRLTLPWLVAAWLGAGALLGKLAERCCAAAQQRDGNDPARRMGTAIIALALGVVALVGASLWSGESVLARGVPGWEDRTDLERATRSAVARAREYVQKELHRDPASVVMYVFGEPAIFFHASGEGVVAAPVANLGFADPRAQRPPVPAFLLAGPPATRSENFASQWRQFGSQFSKVDVIRYQPSDLVLLDEFHPDSLARTNERPQEEIQLFYLK